MSITKFHSNILLALAAGSFMMCGFNTDQHPAADFQLKLPKGFKAITVVKKLGVNRHLAVNSNGDIYVKLERLKDGKGIYVLRKVNGKYEVVKSFGNYGGTGIAIKNGYLYATSNSEVYRYKLNANDEVTDPDHPEKIVTGLVDKGEHNAKSITLDNEGNIFVNVGAPSNSCQLLDRTKGSPAQDPCPILEEAGGVWEFRDNKPDQSYNNGIHYCTGTRNLVALDWNNSVNRLFAVQHGRDQLSTLFPDQYTDEQSASLPGEEFLEIKKGSDFGWPYCYYDGIQKKKVLGPEYGGDGKKAGRCADKDQPLMAFPAHWAPNALLFYTGKMFPEKYHNGAFIAFHGSWNRAPEPQAGFKVIFVPFKNGKPTGQYEVFADGFTGTTGEIKGPSQAMYRPCGLAQGPDGAIYVSDDSKGRIWKIVYEH
ncbi:MAG: PQQ-dependent sugar dehydrogenase [Chitinophagales bacterium]|nr:PQQ-dependent sugar dehydrogenase [Chitinophagales bacterium]